jgi:hypothetical protein
MRLFILSLFLTAFSFGAGAQGSVQGKILDSAGKTPMGLTTITVFKAADTSLITYRLSNPEGGFKIPNLPLNLPLRAVISYSGYEVVRKEFTLTDANTLDLGAIHMLHSSSSLDEVLVVSERPPVSVRKDTIEFNAASFKTLPTALVEDMLKKLPGVQVDAEGNITVNGKKVNRILVDGKEFFGNDPKMATRNLPANMIEKIQVAEDKDERDLNPDRAEGDVGQVINLKLKKAIKKGWFGKAYAGRGTDERYEAGSILNLFRDTMQVSLIGFSNNLSRAGFGFNDIRSLGGFDRSGMNMIMMNSTGGVNVNGINFGGMGEGISRTTGGGFNMNHVLRNGFTLNSQYFYGQSRNDIMERLNMQQFFQDTIQTTRSLREEVAKMNTHRVALGLKGNIDSLTRFDFKPSVTLLRSGNDRVTTSDNASNVKGPLNQSRANRDVTNRELTYSHQFQFFKNFKKKGRNLTVSNAFTNGDIDNDQLINSSNIFFQNTPPDTIFVDQLRARGQRNLNSTLNSIYNDPLSKSLSLRLGYMATYYNNEDIVGTFNSRNGLYEEKNTNLSNELSRESWRHNFSGGLTWKYKKLSIMGTANLQRLDIFNQFQRGTAKQLNQHYNYFLPGGMISWREFSLNYTASVNPPNINDLQPTPDSTSPLFISFGNPDLLPTKSHSFNVNFYKQIPTKLLFLSAYGFANIRDNAVVRARTIDSRGRQTTRPVNVDNIHDLYSNFFLNKQHKFNKNFQVSYGVGYNFNYNRNFVIVNDVKSYVVSFDVSPQASGSFNWKDKIEWNFSANVGRNTTDYENENLSKDLKVIRQSLRTELVIRWPKHIVWEGQLQQTHLPQVAPGLRKDVSLLNAGVTYVFLKEDKGQLKLSGYDLLDQNLSVWRNASENNITDRQVNILQRYFLLTFTYNIRSFKGGKVGGTQRFFMF